MPRLPGRPVTPISFQRLGACVAALVLAAPAFAQQPGVEQTAASGDSASNITSFPPEFFAEFRPNTALDMIGRIPGFSFDGGSSARGFSGTAGNVLIDGERPPSRSDSLGNVLSRISASAVERIDIIRGGADGIDMQGRSIIANVVRKADAGVTGAVSGGLNANTRGDSGRNAQIQMQDQRNGRLIEGALSYGAGTGSGVRTRQWIAPSGDILLDAASRTKNEFENLSATGAYETAMLGGRVRINGKARTESSSFSSEEILFVPGGSQIRGDDNTSNSGEIGLRYNRDFSGYGVEVVAFQSFDQQDSVSTFNTPDFTSGEQSSQSEGESIARAKVQMPSVGYTSIETGAEAVYNWTDEKSTTILNDEIFALAGDVFQADELRAEAFGTLTWEPHESLNAELGARYEWSRITSEVGEAGAAPEEAAVTSEKTLSYFKPRLNISWSPAKNHQINLRVERLVDQLSFESFASSASFENDIFGIGNPDIEPEKSWVAEGRYERQFGGQNSFVAELVHRKTEDILSRIVVLVQNESGDLDLRDITVNLGEETRDSLELSGTLELDRLGLSGGLFNFEVDLRNSKTIDPVTLEERRISGDRPYSWNFSVQQTLANGNFRWALFVEDDADRYNYSTRSFGKQAELIFVGANISWKPAPGWTFGAGVNNILGNGGRGWSVLYDGPRGSSSPLYLSRGYGEGATNFFANLRRNF